MGYLPGLLLNSINTTVKFKNAYELEIINEKTLNVLIFFLTLLKSNSPEPIAYEDVTSVATLLERNLFKLRVDYRAVNFEYNFNNNETSTINSNISLNNDSNYIPRRRKSDYINLSSDKRYKKQDLLMQQLVLNSLKRRKDDFIKSYDKELGRRKDDRVNEELIPKRRRSDWVEVNYPQKRRKEDF